MCRKRKQCSAKNCLWKLIKIPQSTVSWKRWFGNIRLVVAAWTFQSDNGHTLVNVINFRIHGCNGKQCLAREIANMEGKFKIIIIHSAPMNIYYIYIYQAKTFSSFSLYTSACRLPCAAHAPSHQPLMSAANKKRACLCKWIPTFTTAVYPAKWTRTAQINTLYIIIDSIL